MKIFLNILIFLGVFFAFTPAKAQLLEPNTTAEDVAMLFFKLAGAQPDFAEWALYTKAYQSALEDGKEAVQREEAIRLQLEFANINTEFATITIRTGIKGSVEGDREPVLNLRFPEGPVFFPYTHAEIDYGVIAEDIDFLQNIPLGVLEANYVRGRIREDNNLVLVLKIKPYAVDYSEPLEIEDMVFWPLLGRLARVDIYNEKLETAWSWAANWYRTEQGTDIKKLR